MLVFHKVRNIFLKKVLNDFKIIVKTHFPQVWISFFFMVIISCLFRYLINNMTTPKKRNPIQTILHTMKLFFGSPVSVFPQRWSDRIFNVAIMCVGLIIISSYQSNLSNFFIKPLYQPDINTLKQVDQNIDVILTRNKAIMDDIFPANISQTITNLQKKVQLNQDIPSPILRYLLSDEKYHRTASTTRRTDSKTYDSEYFMRKLVHRVAECPRTYNLGYIVPKDSAYEGEMAHFILYVKQGGFFEHWRQEMLYNQTLQDRKFLWETYIPPKRALTLVDLQLGYYILAAGYCLSLIVFCLECVYENFRATRNAKKGRIVLKGHRVNIRRRHIDY